jgi:hypothetical protein
MKGMYITRNFQLAYLATEKPKAESDQKKAIVTDMKEEMNNCTDDNNTTSNTWLVFDTCNTAS